jgi:hypothetical protein
MDRNDLAWAMWTNRKRILPTQRHDDDRAAPGAAMPTARRGMRRQRRRLVACLLGMAIGLAPAAPPAGADEDAREIRKAVEAGEVVPLQSLLDRLRERFQGRVVKVELERENHGEKKRRWVYEIKVLTAEGNVLKLEYDAKTMELIKVRGRREPGRHREDDD